MVAGTVLFKKFAPEGELWVGTAVQSLAAGSARLDGKQNSRGQEPDLCANKIDKTGMFFDKTGMAIRQKQSDCH